MSEPALWLTFLEDATGRPAPQLRTGPEPDAPEVELTDRARWVLAAISLPRELAPETASEQHSARLGSRLWSSGEIIARIPYQHRSTIRLGLQDLRDRLREHALVLEEFMLIDTDRGRYAARAGRLNVDLVDLYEIRGDPGAFDRRLEAGVGDRSRARLAPACSHLLAEAPRRALEAAIAASAGRASVVASGPTADAQSPATPAQPLEGAQSPAAAQSPRRRLDRHPRGFDRHPRRRAALVRTLAAVLVVAVAGALIPVFASGHHRRVHALGPPRREVSGGVAHTWSDPKLAGGRPGPEIMPRQRVLIACRLRGFKVPDGNVWWYLLASPPWSQHYYATADAFYNNGHTSGSLRGSAFVDLRVALCS